MGEEARLARDIIDEHFGPIIAPVAELMIQRYPGYTSLSTLIDLCAPIQHATVRRALLVMLRHNLVTISKKAPVEKEPGPLLYAIKLPQVASRLHFPEYSNQAQDLFGDAVSCTTLAFSPPRGDVGRSITGALPAQLY